MTDHRDHLILFDIDLTIMTTGACGTKAMEKAFSEYSGKNEVVSIRFDGKTDPLIVPELFKANGQNYLDNQYEDFLSLYLHYLDIEQQQAIGWKLLPGVKELITSLDLDKHSFLSLVTGNDERGARLKLKPFDLNKYFPVGGFASDDPVRAKIINIAIKRAIKHYKLDLSNTKITLIGDATGDVIAANIASVNCIAVGTGHTSAKELADAGKCTILENLSDTKQVFEILNRN